MAVQINTYGGLKAGVLAWLARSGDSLLDSRFDDFLLNCERRIYYGFAADDPANSQPSAAAALRSDPLRTVDMETADPAFALSAVTPQPATFLELISAQLNSPNAPLQIVAQRTIDGYASATQDQPRLIAVSGTNFRVFPDPGTAAYTATLRYYQKLATPAGATVNAILTGSPDVYLYGCLVEASIFTQDEPGALRYLALYNASVAGLNARTQRITGSSVPVIRLRAGMAP
jgi:hypothetical protein